jgi:hypothetical protein
MQESRVSNFRFQEQAFEWDEIELGETRHRPVPRPREKKD